MKKVFFGLMVLTALGLILVACPNPVELGENVNSDRAIAVLGESDKLAAVVVAPVVSGRTNASGKDISSNSQGGAVAGMYFFWDPKQKDNGYLKVDASVFDSSSSFILTTKEANKYWDFVIGPKKGQAKSDGCFVFYIPKQEKNINGVWISDYVAKAFVLQDFDYTENPIDIPNPDRGYYRANDGMVVPITGSATSGTLTVGGVIAVGSGNPVVNVDTRVVHMYLDMRNYSSNMPRTRPTAFNTTYVNNLRNTLGNPALTVPEALDYWKANVYGPAPKGTDDPITADGLAYIRNKFQQVRNSQATVIPRFNYDGGGWSWVDATVSGVYVDECVYDYVEPPKEVVLAQLAQMKEIFYDYEDVIMAVDGGFFGPWGEMHGTVFGRSSEAYAWLLEGLLDAVPPSRSIQVHGGAFLSWYNTTYGTSYNFTNMDTIPAPVPGTPEARFGFFNDSYAMGQDGVHGIEEGEPDD